MEVAIHDEKTVCRAQEALLHVGDRDDPLVGTDCLLSEKKVPIFVFAAQRFGEPMNLPFEVTGMALWCAERPSCVLNADARLTRG